MEQAPPNQPEASGVVTIRNSKGLHARPSHAVVSMAMEFSSEIEIRCRTTTANAKSILEMLTLAAAYGDELHLSAAGADSEAAIADLCALIDSGFDEE